MTELFSAFLEPLLEILLVFFEVPVLGIAVVGIIVVQVLFDGALALGLTCALGLLGVMAVKYWSTRRTVFRVIVLCVAQALVALGYGGYFSDSEHSNLVWMGAAAWVIAAIAAGWLTPKKKARAPKVEDAPADPP